MRTYLIIIALFICISCSNYDPLVEGKDIWIDNQSTQAVYVIDSLNFSGNIKLFDTFLVNDSKYISTKGNYVHGYSNWNFFLSNKQINKIKEDHGNELWLYFIKDTNFKKNIQEIKKRNLYDSLRLDLNELIKGPVNHVFYTDSTIKVVHEFNMRGIRK